MSVSTAPIFRALAEQIYVAVCDEGLDVDDEVGGLPVTVRGLGLCMLIGPDQINPDDWCNPDAAEALVMAVGGVRRVPLRDVKAYTRADQQDVWTWQDIATAGLLFPQPIRRSDCKHGV